MPEIEKLNLDSLRPKPVPMAPVSRPSEAETIVPVEQPAPRRDWFKIILASAVVFLLAYILFDRGVIPTPGPPQPDIDADGFYVMVIQPSDEGSLTTGQKEFLRSAKVADWVTDNGGEYRAYPQEQDITSEQQVWRDIRGQLSPPFSVGVVSDRKLTKLEAPNGIDAGIEALEELK